MRQLLVMMVVTLQAAGAAAAVRFDHGALEALAPEAAGEAAYLARQGCLVAPLSGEHLALLEEATRRVADAASDGGLRTTLRAKPDWVVENEEAWSPAPAGDTVHGALERLAGDGGDRLHVEVLTYGRGPGHPCSGPLGEKGIHAYSRPGKPFVVLRRDYVEKLKGQRDGVALLAGTLAHEVLHVLGHAHPNAIAEIGGHAYANSVPVYVGCAVAAWPDVDAISQRCRPTTHERRATSTVDAAPKAADQRPASREPASKGEAL